MTLINLLHRSYSPSSPPTPPAGGDAPAVDLATNATTHSFVLTDPLATCLNRTPAFVSVGGPAPKPQGTWILALGGVFGSDRMHRGRQEARRPSARFRDAGNQRAAIAELHE